jgi:Ca2+/Na+ antiporter
MQGIYTFIPETNHVVWVYCVAVVLYLQFALYVMLFFVLYYYYHHHYHHNAVNQIKIKVPTPNTSAVPKTLVLYIS